MTTEIRAKFISIVNMDGSETEILRNGKITPKASAWIPMGDGITSCFFCGKKLTDELSFARGVGPECIKKNGSMPGRNWIEEHAKAFRKFARKCEKEGRTISRMSVWMKQEGIKMPSFEEAI